jgi:Flp pilus assembly protein TadD
VTQLSRFFLGPIMALCSVTALGFPAFAQDLLPLNSPTVTGSYLAGQQALTDLSTQEAAQYFMDAARSDWENPVLVGRAFLATAADGQIESAAATAKHLLELEPNNELARMVVATQALKERRYSASIDELNVLGTDSFTGITGSILKAWAYVGDNKAGEASTMLETMGKDGLEDFLVFHRALMADVSGDSKQAIELAKRAYEADPYVARIVEAYVRILGNAGQFDEASKVLADFTAQGLTHPLVDVVAKSIAAKQKPGKFAASVQVGAAEMYHGIGIALARDGSNDLAVVFLRLGLYLDPSADVISLALAQLLDTAGRHDTANALYDAVPATSPMKPTAVVRVATNLDAMGDRKEAIRRLSNIVATSPKDIDAISVLGDLQRYDSQYADAATTYTKALEVVGGEHPGDWRFYYVRGIAYERNGEWPKAEADFLKALKLNPEQPQVMNYLGYSWVDQGMNLGPALDLIQKAVNAVPDDGYIVDSLGWAFYKLNRIDEAVKVLEQAVQLKPNDPEINDHLGDAYWKAGRTLEARFQWNVASAVDKEGNVKKRAAPKLANGLDPNAKVQ